ncbi:dihydrofolate reductase, partial [Burkholderia multivorans]
RHAIAQRAQAFRMPVSYFGPREHRDSGYRFVPDLIALARDSDVLVVAASADHGKVLITAEVLAALGRDGFLINVARGKLVDETALVRALADGTIAGAGLDVFANEPQVPPALLELDRVV